MDDESISLMVLTSSFIIWQICLLSQLLIIVVVLRMGEWKTKSGFALILSLAVSDLIQCCFWGVWGGLESLFSLRAFAHSELVIGAVANLTYAVMTMHIVAMCVNRVVAICFPLHFARLFTAYNTRVIIASLWLVAGGYASMRIFVCCPLYYDHLTLTAVTHLPVVNGTTDPTANDMFQVDQALSMFGMFPTTFGYIWVFVKLLLLRRNAGMLANTSTVDVRLSIQFFMILFFYLTMSFAWLFAPKTAPGAYVLTLATALNYGCNPAVYLLFNATIRRGAGELLCPTKTPVTTAPTADTGPLQPATATTPLVVHSLAATNVTLRNRRSGHMFKPGSLPASRLHCAAKTPVLTAPTTAARPQQLATATMPLVVHSSAAINGTVNGVPEHCSPGSPLCDAVDSQL